MYKQYFEIYSIFWSHGYQGTLLPLTNSGLTSPHANKKIIEKKYCWVKNIIWSDYIDIYVKCAGETVKICGWAAWRMLRYAERTRGGLTLQMHSAHFCICHQTAWTAKKWRLCKPYNQHKRFKSVYSQSDFIKKNPNAIRKGQPELDLSSPWFDLR